MARSMPRSEAAVAVQADEHAHLIGFSFADLRDFGLPFHARPRRVLGRTAEPASASSLGAPRSSQALKSPKECARRHSSSTALARYSACGMLALAFLSVGEEPPLEHLRGRIIFDNAFKDLPFER